MSTFAWIPSFGSALNVKPAVTAVKFGDGYEARMTAGLNYKPRRWQVTFNNRANATADAIEAFLDARGALEAFDWTPTYGNAGVWVCREWQATPTGPFTRTITATFEEVFEYGIAL